MKIEHMFTETKRTRRAAVVASLLALLVALGVAPPALAVTAGDLDTSFSGDGRLTTDFDRNDDAWALGVQSDGKIVAAGADFTDFALARYNTDGSLDTTFGSGGKVTTDFTTGSNASGDFARALAIQSDGKIVAAGGTFDANSGNVDLALARYNTDGSLDTTFGSGGKVITSFSGSGSTVADALAIQSDGKIVAAGSTSTGSGSSFALARYNTDGSLDANFSGDGKLTVDFGGDNAFATALGIQPDGKIVVAGGTGSSSSSDFALARYFPDGSLDTSFDSDGKVITDFGGSSTDADTIAALAIQADGKIVVSGSSQSGSFLSTREFALARYNTNGSLDTTFDSDGKVITDLDGDGESANALGVQSDGKIVAAGSVGFENTADFALARYNTDGSLDTTFSFDGKVITDFDGTPDGANALAIQPDGRIVVAGHSDHLNSFGGFYGDFALARYYAVTDTTAPTVASLTPPTTRSGNITVQFSEPMDPKSLMQNPTDPTQLSTSATIKLLVGDSTSTTEVPAKVRCTDASCRTVVLDPDVRLGSRKTYTVRIEGAGDTDGLAVKDLVGNELAADYVSSFKTKRR